MASFFHLPLTSLHDGHSSAGGQAVKSSLRFDVPTLQTIVDHGADEAIVAMLDVVPDAHWLKLFDERVAALKGESVPPVIDTGFYYYDASNMNSPEIAAVLYD